MKHKTTLELNDYLSNRLRDEGRKPYWLAKAAGCSTNTIYEILSGKRRPSWAMLRRILIALGDPDPFPWAHGGAE